ncbi:unnamed protein product [Rotaria sp. Silwood1]|nr:unnamed protein product [Rotaria sp. Silwood1]
MSKSDTASATFEEIDTNQDGRIDKDEFRKWVSNTKEWPSSSYESSTGGFNGNDNTTRRFYRNKYKFGSQNALDHTADKYASYETTAVSNQLINHQVINTSSSEETEAYLEKSASLIYKDPNPRIIRRATSEGPVRYAQRIFVRYLQPPAVPPPGPLIIKEVRPAPPSPPSPLIIRQHATPLPQPPPLILRERPPTPPAPVPSETVIRHLPPIPVPPRSVVIERFPPPPQKPRDIIIERWIPYGPPPKRRTIVEHASASVVYPEPHNTVIIYDTIEARVVRQFQRLGVIKANPADYVARYGSSLLNSTTLVQQAHNAGVTEDTSPPVPSSSIYTNIWENNVDFNQSNEIINQDFSLPNATSYEGIQQTADTEAIRFGNINYLSSSSASNLISDANLTATNISRDEQLKQTKFQRYI